MTAQEINLTGDLSFDTIPSKSDELMKILNDKFVREVSLNLARVVHCDSAGVALMIECKRWALQLGKSLKFLNVPPQMQAIASFCGVSSILE